MKLKSDTGNFGVVIAFLVPGFVSLLGVRYHSDIIKQFFNIDETNAPTVGGFLYATLSSVAAGVTISSLRWILIDIIICKIFKVKKRELDFKRLVGKEEAFSFINENHYRYYQYYANMLVAIFIAYILRIVVVCGGEVYFWNKREMVLLVGFLMIEIVLGIGAWDTRRKFYERAEAILVEI